MIRCRNSSSVVMLPAGGSVADLSMEARLTLRFFANFVTLRETRCALDCFRQRRHLAWNQVRDFRQIR